VSGCRLGGQVVKLLQGPNPLIFPKKAVGKIRATNGLSKEPCALEEFGIRSKCCKSGGEKVFVFI
jgi:hypothetical protein